MTPYIKPKSLISNRTKIQKKSNIEKSISDNSIKQTASKSSKNCVLTNSKTKTMPYQNTYAKV